VSLWEIKETDPFVALSKQDCDMSLGRQGVVKGFRWMFPADSAGPGEHRKGWTLGELTFWICLNGGEGGLYGPSSGLVAKHKIANCQIEIGGGHGED
jgi:hypothetical protein